MHSTRRAPLAGATEFVTRSYESISTQNNFTPRLAQVGLSDLIAQALKGRAPLMAEAPTGTGKTIAYLIGALAAERDTGVPIVVATATKALQQQLVTNDLPRLLAAGLLQPQDVALAKGKGNYLCVRNAVDLQYSERQGSLDPEAFLSEKFLKASGPEVEAVTATFARGAWNGDFDQYDGALSTATRQALAVSSDTCNRKKCEHYEECAYYRAKAATRGCKLIVTNHDLLLTDLLLASAGVEPTLGLPKYHLVVDEAHHLPQKAIQVGSHDAPLTQLLLALPKLQGMQRLMKGSPELAQVLTGQGLEESALDKTACMFALRALIFALMEFPVDEESYVMRFSGGELPAMILELTTALKPILADLTNKLHLLNSALKDAEGLSPLVLEKARELQHRALDVKLLTESSHACCVELLESTEHAKWLFHKEDSLSLHCAPLEGALVLNKLLWGVPRICGVVLVSATLQDVDGFSRYKKKVGAPGALTKVLPHTFVYEDSELVVAAMASTPKPAERRLFIEELKRELPLALDQTEGSLVLFPSWALLREMVPTLKGLMGDAAVKVQGEQPVRLLVDAHKRDIDQGKGSLLAGVATMSEGLDLPGDYCRHVVVIALPFSPPSTPVEQELAERLGPRYFSERSLPDAMQRLTQMVGRLLRRESDFGRVTVFDRRLAATSYGRQMLRALPPFKVLIRPMPGR